MIIRVGVGATERQAQDLGFQWALKARDYITVYEMIGLTRTRYYISDEDLPETINRYLGWTPIAGYPGRPR
jgi:CTP-dependent riboflavin kinase